MYWAMWSAGNSPCRCGNGARKQVYLVTSGSPLYAANNICKAIERRLPARKAGAACCVICNAKNQPKEEELVAEFARRVNSHLVQFIPRDCVVQLAELNRSNRDSNYSGPCPGSGNHPRSCVRVMENTRFTIPTPL